MMPTKEEMLEALHAHYLLWLKASYQYHYDTSYNEGLPFMSDSLWDGLARNYAQNLEHFPYLKSIDFDGSTMGVKVDPQGLLDEINKLDNYQPSAQH